MSSKLKTQEVLKFIWDTVKNTKIKAMKKLVNIVYIVFITMIATVQGQSDSILVFELFTSQGCSSCPPADKALDLIKHTKQDKQIFVLSYHVDYWNRLGWKDPFSTAAVTAYQQAYATQFNSRSMYTPQVVVNGSTHFVGSNGPQLKKALDEYAIHNDKHSIGITNVDQTKMAITFQSRL